MKRITKVFSLVLNRRHILISSIVMIALIAQGFIQQFTVDKSAEIKPVTTRTSSKILNQGKPEMLETYANLPLHFEANLGQADPRVSFLSRGRSYDLFLTSTEAVFSFKKLVSDDTGNTPVPKLNSAPANPAVMRMKLIGANQAAKHVGLSKLVTKTNYFIGNHPQEWRTNISTYAKVQQRNVYPGVDLVYYGNQQQLEYDFVVSPGADYNAIKLDFEGPQKVEIESNGDLALHVAEGVVRQRKPFIYQEVDGRRQRIDGGYVLVSSHREHNRSHSSHQVGFRVDQYDPNKDLIIDPVLSYSTYLGGSDSEGDSYIAVDNIGSAYITGSTNSLNFPIANPLQGNLSSVTCAFISKLNPSGTELIFSTYLGGSVGATGAGITVDESGIVYVTGSTGSPDFPTVNPIQANFGGHSDVFVTKLNATGSAILFSTFLGGTAGDDGSAISVDNVGNTYVAGGTTSFDFPTVNPVHSTFGGITDAFVAKLSDTGPTLVYSTFFGGNGGDGVSGAKVDGAGNVYVTGETFSTDFPTTPGAFQTNFSGNGAAFAFKLNAAGSAIVYSTYLGGTSDYTRAGGIAVDHSGNAYVAGRTSAPDFPTVNALQGTKGAIEDAFVTKINSSGSALIFSTFLGGDSFDASNGVAIDAAENVYITGETSSADFPTSNALQPALGGPSGTSDAFVAKLNSAGSALVYSTYFGGSENESGFGIGVDTAGNAYVSGITESSDFQTTPGAFQTTFNGITDPFVLKIAGNETTTGTGVSVQSGQVTTTFGTVASSGITTVDPIDPALAGAVPSAYTLADFSSAFDIQTSAVVSGPITIGFNVSLVNDPDVFAALRVLHNEGGVLIDRTVLPPDSPAPDFASRTIFARVSSLSPFVIVKLKSAEMLLNELIALVKSFNLQRGIENSLDAKLQNAQAALSAAKAKDKVSACQMMAAFNNEVQAQRGKAITEGQANQLISGANQIRTALGCLN